MTPDNIKKLGNRLPYGAKKEIEKATGIPYTTVDDVFRHPERERGNRQDAANPQKVVDAAIEILKAKEIPYLDLME